MSYILPFIRVSIDDIMCHSFLLYKNGKALCSSTVINELKPLQSYTVGNLDIIECKCSGNYSFDDDENIISWHTIFDYQYVDNKHSFYEEFIHGNILSSEENGWYISNGINYGNDFISFYDIYVSISDLDVKTFKKACKSRNNIESMLQKMLIST